MALPSRYGPACLWAQVKVVVLGSGSLLQVILTVLSSWAPSVAKEEPLKKALS